MPDRVYLDWNATTPLRPEARAAMAAAWDLCGNPSSVHAEGRSARRLVEDARALVAKAVGTAARNVVFTSGGTEANALALTPGLRGASGQPVARLLISAIEHLSVLAGGRFAAEATAKIGATRAGLVDLEQLRAMLASGPPALVSVMAANNETGVIQPVAEVAEIVHGAGGLLHVDAIQAFGKIPFNTNAIGADIATLSAHKIGGPKGVGAVVLADGLAGLEPLLRGGGQELGRRAGTENVVGIAGFGAAVSAAMDAREADAIRIQVLRDRLDAGLRDSGRATVIARLGPRLPNTTLFIAPGVKA
jgi:cysteine desulfurase